MADAPHDIARPAAWPPPADTVSIAAALAHARLRDRVGHEVHAALAVAYLLLLPLATTPKDVAAAALAAWAVIRLPRTWSCYTALVRDRLLWLLAAWTAWHAAGLLWSPDVAAGWDELHAYRVLVTPLVLWPVLDRAPWLVGALLAGVLAQNLVQLGQGLEVLGLEPSFNDRLPGLVHPIHTGAFCAAAMCWHVAAILNPHGAAAVPWLGPAPSGAGKACGPQRWLLPAASVAGLAAATTGLVFTGSRGPWISAAIAVPLGVVVTGLRRPRARRPALALAVIGLAGAGGGWLLAGDFVTMRAEQAVADVRAAGSGDYESDTGERIARWSAAWAAFLDRPVTGTGPGGFATARATRDPDSAAWGDHHAHSLYMHELATAGAPGAVLLLAIIVIAVARAARGRPDHPYADGTLFALVAWLVGAQFDCYQLAGNMFGLFTFIVALTLPHRATIR